MRLRFRRPIGLLASALVALIALGAARGAPQHVHLVILGTTDTHGNIEPWDYYRNQPANRGLAKIATLVKQVRASERNVLLLDSGDTIQGTPLAYYFAEKDTHPPNPSIAVMNAMGYDAMAVGNHEFNFGLGVLWHAKQQARFPWLAANLHESYRPGDPGYIAPYVVKKIAGVRVGIVGFVTPGVPRWEVPQHYAGYEFQPIVDAAQLVLPELRKQCDFVVAIVHSGLDRDPKTGEPSSFPDIPGENVAWELADQVPGIDVILYGHTHLEMPELVVRGALMAQAKNWGQSLARVDVELDRSGNHWAVESKHSTTIPVTTEVAADTEILKIAEPYHAATQKYLDTPIATCDRDLDGLLERYQDGPLVDLIHRVQLDAGHADVSLATLLYPEVHIAAGQVTVRQIAALYVYENTLYTVEMNGAQLKDALEHAASYFPAWPAAPGERLKLPGYNADSAKGVSYQIDLTRPVGDRIRGLEYRGKPLDPAQKLRVAINNYRYAGGGKYTALQGLPVVYRSPVEIRELIIAYVLRAGKIASTSDGSWRLEPAEVFAAIAAQVQSDRAKAGGPASSR